MQNAKLPPQALELERAVLGALLLDKDAILAIANLLPENAFYSEKNGMIYKAIKQLSKEGMQIDLITISNQLRKNGNLEQIGGYIELVSLANCVGSSAHIEQHAKLVAQKYVQRVLIEKTMLIQNAAFDESKDLEDILIFTNSSFDEVYSLLDTGSEEKSWKEIVNESIYETERRQLMRNEGKCTGVPTPLNTLNKWTQGWQSGQVIVIAARPSMGKTAVSIALMKTAAENGFNPCYFSLETSASTLASRMLLGLSDVDSDKFRTGDLNKYDWAQIEMAADELKKLDIYMNDKSCISIDYIKMKCRALKRKNKCGIIFIDYLQLASIEGIKGNREQEVAKMSRECKVMAKELEVPVILLSQLSRKVEERADKTPMLSDLRESGAIEQDADMVLFLNRPEKYGIEQIDGFETTKGLGFVIIAKNKEGRLGEVPFRYNDSLTKISDWNTFEQQEDNVFPSGTSDFVVPY